MPENNRPIYKYQIGSVECAVWAKQAADGRPYFQFTFQKTYKTKDGEYMHTTSFNKADLPLLATLANRACMQEIAKQATDVAGAKKEEEGDVPF